MRETQIKRGIHFFLRPGIFFWLAVSVILVSGSYRPLWDEANDPLGFFLGAIVGVICYYGAVALVSWEFSRVREYVHAVRSSFTNARPPVCKMLTLAGRAIYEEAFWRGTIQVLLGNGILALFLTALLFTLRHIYLYFKRQPLTVPFLLEFFLFSLLLGVLYLLSGRIMLVVAIHFVRNLLITAGCSLPKKGIPRPHQADDCIQHF